MRKNNGGFSLIELLVVMVIIAILAAVAIPNIIEYYRGYRYQQYLLEVESTLKWARMIAIERSINTAVCSQGNGIVVFNMNTQRNITCTGQVLRSVLVEARDGSFIQINMQGNTGFDPRGLALGGATVEVRRTDRQRCGRYVIQGLSSSILREECQ